MEELLELYLLTSQHEKINKLFSKLKKNTKVNNIIFESLLFKPLCHIEDFIENTLVPQKELVNIFPNNLVSYLFKVSQD